MITTNTASGKSSIQQFIERTEITRKFSAKLSSIVTRTSGILKGSFVIISLASNDAIFNTLLFFMITLVLVPLDSLMSFCSFSHYVLTSIERTEIASKPNQVSPLAKRARIVSKVNHVSPLTKRDFCGGR